MGQVKLDKLLWQTVCSEMEAIKVLQQNKLHSHALSSMYSAIDKMAWLCTLGNKSGGNEFKKWVDSYFMAGEALEYTSKDLWAARCGLLHTGAAESDLYRDDKANLIYYTTKPNQAREEIIEIIGGYLRDEKIPESKVVLVDYFALIIRFLESLQRFTEALKNDSQLHSLAAEKAGKQLGFTVRE
ncbi:hypothetical protein [Pseudomonas sp. GL-RE-20]|uniref:hypothetical protein n=1 Tax=Pseudomonas sp. GL-RE-20 TaxID=2832372 RepID=UPI001CBC7CC0|nr:hypothetical protein [Pseudomonas sp. GL-RE-20]